MAKGKKSSKETAPVTAKIIPSKDVQSERIYANFVVIEHTSFDFSIKFCDFSPPDEKDKANIIQTKTIKAPIQAEIVIPTTLVESLIKALTVNYGEYLKLYGKQQK